MGTLPYLPAEAWQNQLSFLIARHANNLARWQLGAEGSDEFVSPDHEGRVYTQVLQSIFEAGAGSGFSDALAGVV